MTFMYPEQDVWSNTKNNFGQQQELQMSYNKAVWETMCKGKLTYWEMHRVGDVVCWSTEELAEIFGVKAK